MSLGPPTKPAADDGGHEERTAPIATLTEDTSLHTEDTSVLMVLDVVFSDFDWSLTVTNPITQQRVIKRRDDRSDALADDPASRAGTIDSLRAAIRSLVPGARAMRLGKALASRSCHRNFRQSRRPLLWR